MRKQLEQQLQLSDPLALTDTDSVGSLAIYGTPGSCRGAPALAPAASLGAGTATRPYRPELYSPTAEATALWQRPSCHALGQPAGGGTQMPNGADWQQPVAWPAQVPCAAGSLLAQLAADLAPLSLGAGSADPGTTFIAPVSGSAGAACSAETPLVAVGSTGTECPAAASQPLSQQAMPSTAEQAWGSTASSLAAVPPATNLGDHLSACSEASPSTAALTLRPRNSHATSSSCSTLAEVLSLEGSLQGAPAGPGGATAALGAVSLHCQQRHSLQQGAPLPFEAAQQHLGSPATPGAACGLGDHLSDATPTGSEAGSSWSLKVPAHGEVVSLSLRGASSSCEEAAGAASGGVQRQGKEWGGLGALRALKSRLSQSRSAGSAAR